VDGVNPQIALCGNIDPVAVLLNQTPEQVTEAVRQCRAAGGNNWLAAPGCEIPRNTPAENVLAINAALMG
jgi:uroporphyrinogen-III decarboxylase